MAADLKQQATAADLKQQATPQIQSTKKKSMSFQGFINSPWLLISIPLLIGGFYLVAHPELITVGINHPYAVASILAIPLAIFLVKLIINFFSVIEQWIRLQFDKARGSKQGYFFEAVIVVFMFVSVCEAGPFFNDIQHNVLNGVLGYITVLAFDLIAVVCIDARRKEKAKGGSMAGIYLVGVILCALVSMVANLYSALQNFQAPASHNFPEFLKSIAPYVGIMFPVMIIFLAFSRDAEIEIDDAEAYKKQQQKRVEFLAVRREIMEKVASEMERIELLKKREFILKSLLFTQAKLQIVIEVVTGKIRQDLAPLQEELAKKNQTIAEQATQVQQLLGEIQEQQKIITLQVAQQANFQSEMIASYREFQARIEQKIEEEMTNFRTDFAQEIASLSDNFSAEMDEKFEQNLANFCGDLEEKSEEKRTDPALKIVRRSRQTQPLNDPEDGQKSEENEEKKLIGLTYQQASQLAICRRKNIKVSDLRAAVRNHELHEKSDHSLARSAVENWARKQGEKVS